MSRDGSVETWSRVIHTEADMPAGCVHHIRALFSVLPYCVRAPASGGGYGRAPTSLVCLGEGKIVIINADTPASEPLVMPLVSIAAVESGRNLLLSWLALYHGGRRHVIWYNAVGYELYEPLILTFREAHEQAPRSTGSIAVDPLEPLLGLDYKYYTRSHAVLGGRMPTAYLYHPAIEIQRRLFSSRIISAYLLVAAGSMVYSLSEESIVRPRRTACYSMVVRYIPCDAGYSLPRRAEYELYTSQELVAASQPIMTLPVAASEAVAFDSFVAGLQGPSVSG